MRDELQIETEELKIINKDEAILTFKIVGLSKVDGWRVQEQIGNKICNELAEKWVLENATKVYESISVNQVINSIILQLGDRIAPRR